MAWESRHRINGRVVRIYRGTGEIGHAAADADDARRQRKIVQRDTFNEIDTAIAELDDSCNLLFRAARLAENGGNVAPNVLCYKPRIAPLRRPLRQIEQQHLRRRP